MGSEYFKCLAVVVLGFIARDCYLRSLNEKPQIIVTIPAECAGMMAKGKVVNGTYPCKGLVSAKWEQK